MQSSAIARTSRTVSVRTPVLAKTGTASAASFAARNSASGAGEPVIGPETQSASGSEENATDRATAAISRGATGAANSALIVKKRRTLVASIARRYWKTSPAAVFQSPRSPAKTPVKTSRANRAPVAFATASVAIGSQRTSTPKGTESVGATACTAAATVATVSGPTRVR